MCRNWHVCVGRGPSASAAEGLCRTAAPESAAGLLCRTAGRRAQGFHKEGKKIPALTYSKLRSVCRNWHVCVGRGASVSAAEGLCRMAAPESAAGLLCRTAGRRVQGFHKEGKKIPALT